MTVKKYLILMTLATLFCFVAWFEVVFFVNPFETGMLGFILFYVSLLFMLWGIFSIIGFIIRYIFLREEFERTKIKVAFRQGLFFAFLLCGALFLQAEKLLVWWNLILFIVFLALVEYIFMSTSAVSEN